MRITIRSDDLTSPEIADLIRTHHAYGNQHSPRESAHALDIKGLAAPDLTFWRASIDGQLAGCGALKQLDPRHGEIKSMHTLEQFRGKGVAVEILNHLIGTAKDRGYARLSLETGSNAPFAAARRLYQRFGFVECDPFANYRVDPNSVFMTRLLS